MLNLPLKLRTHPVFYADMFESYQDPSHVNADALAPSKTALQRAFASVSGRQADPPSVAAATMPADASALLPVCFESES